MERGSTLFRGQALSRANNKLYGDVVAVPKLSHVVLSALLLMWIGFLLYAVIFFELESYQSHPATVLLQNGNQATVLINQTESVSALTAGTRAKLRSKNAEHTEVYDVEVIAYTPHSGHVQISLKEPLVQADNLTLVVRRENWPLRRILFSSRESKGYGG